MQYPEAKTALVNFRISSSEKDAVTRLAREWDVPASHIVRTALRQFLRERDEAVDQK